MSWLEDSRLKNQGFTLAEMLVALTILVSLTVLVMPFAYDRFGPISNGKASATELVGLMEEARVLAVSTSQTVTFSIEQYARENTLPIKTSTAVIEFFPGGGSNGATISMGSGQNSILITVNWLTGKVLIEEDHASSI